MHPDIPGREEDCHDAHKLLNSLLYNAFASNDPVMVGLPKLSLEEATKYLDKLMPLVNKM